MRLLRLSFALTFFLLFQLPTIYAQIDKGYLIMGQSGDNEINPSEKHTYKVILDSDQFALFKLTQRGVDIRITTYNPNGERLEEFDSPNGRRGPELFTITSDQGGDYLIEILPFDENEPKGNYDLNIEFMKAKAVTPNEQVDELFAAWDNSESPGVAVAVVKDGDIIYKKGYGLANLEYDVPIETNSVFHIASVSKQFTVFSILLLEEDGKLSLDDDIRKYIPEVPDFGKPITLRHLATHTSGLRDQWVMLSMAGWRMDDVITKEHILKLVSTQKELNFEPGEKYNYCNTGFTLLAEVVARVSEMTFAEYTKAHIFDPLGMEFTQFYDDHERIVKNRAYSYYSDEGGYKKSVLNYANVGATSLFTTVEDLSKWSANFKNLTVGTQAMIDKMNTPAILNDGETFGGALGQFVGTYKGLNEIQHGGADAGYRSYLTRFPDQDFAVIVFSNTAEFNPGGMAHKVVDIYLKNQLIADDSSEGNEESQVQEEIAVSPDLLQSYVGEYELMPGFIVEISENNGKLSAIATGQEVVECAPLSQTEFELVSVGAKIEFMPPVSGVSQGFKLYQGGQIMEAKRLAAFDKEAVILEELVGVYYSDELKTSYSFVLVDDHLVVKHDRLSDFQIHPIAVDKFSGDAWFFGGVDIVRNEEGEVSGLKISNGRVVDLYFEKVI